MGILGDLFSLADDIVSIPTDFIGLTNHHSKKEAQQIAEKAFKSGRINAEQYIQLLQEINK